jgi:hypothetical protein
MLSRGASFQKDELNGFLEVMEQVKPIGGEEWNEVCHLHNKNFLGKHLTADMLCWKFQMMYLLKPPTGNPTIPLEVSGAKLINNEIEFKVNIDNGQGTNGSAMKIQQMEATLFLTLKKYLTKMKYLLLKMYRLLKVKQNLWQPKMLPLGKQQQNLQMMICINCNHPKNQNSN